MTSHADYAARTEEVVIQRFRRAGCKFEGIVASTEAKSSTGSSLKSDIERETTAIYNGNCTVSHIYTCLCNQSLSPGSEFVIHDALKYLRTTHT